MGTVSVSESRPKEVKEDWTGGRLRAMALREEPSSSDVLERERKNDGSERDETMKRVIRAQQKIKDFYRKNQPVSGGILSSQAFASSYSWSETRVFTGSNLKR